MAIQARERWSTTEEVHVKPGHCWYAQASDVLEVRKITKRDTIAGQPYHPGDYCIRIGRYFDRDSADPSGLTLEEWQPELVFTEADKGEKLKASQLAGTSRSGARHERCTGATRTMVIISLPPFLESPSHR